MTLSRIQLTPNMDPTAMAQAINQNFEQIEAENRTKVVTDENGVKRILLGRGPKGNYVLAITIPSKDVLESLGK